MIPYVVVKIEALDHMYFLIIISVRRSTMKTIVKMSVAMKKKFIAVKILVVKYPLDTL